VAGGGRLFATAGAGMFDERNQPNKVLRELLCVEQTALEEVGPQIDYIKQDIAFVEPINMVTRKHGDQTESIPVLCVRSVIQTSGGTEILANFSDNSPAVTKRIVGKGQAIYCGFLPALSYYKPAIPKRPVDRTSAEDSLAHLIPAKFDTAAYDLTGLPVKRLVVTPAFQVPPEKITLASGQSPAVASDEKGMVSITFDLDVADAIILRK
jgi:beta-galactosidase GanA